MSSRAVMTLYLDLRDALSIQQLAQSEGLPTAAVGRQLIREALTLPAIKARLAQAQTAEAKQPTASVS